MHRGYEHDGWGGGHWIVMAVLMIAFWAVLVWAVVTVVRRGGPAPHPSPGASPATPAPPPRPTPQEILAERLARGEIEPDDYRRRLDALQNRPGE